MHRLYINYHSIDTTFYQFIVSFSHDLIGHLGISSQGTETVIPETQYTSYNQQWNVYQKKTHIQAVSKTVILVM